MSVKSNPDSRTGAVVTSAELEELVVRMVDIWVGEMQRHGELRLNATVQELEEFKTAVVDTLLGLFTSMDGFRENLHTCTKAEVVEIVGRYLQAIS